MRVAYVLPEEHEVEERIVPPDFYATIETNDQPHRHIYHVFASARGATLAKKAYIEKLHEELGGMESICQETWGAVRHKSVTVYWLTYSSKRKWLRSRVQGVPDLPYQPVCPHKVYPYTYMVLPSRSVELPPWTVAGALTSTFEKFCSIQ